MARLRNREDIYGVKTIKTDPFTGDPDTAETGFRHSDAYHRFFRGYTEVRREKPGGVFRIERYYTQDWIEPAGSRLQDVLYRVACGGLTAFAWLATLVGCGAEVPSNGERFPAVFAAAAVILLLILTGVVLLAIFSSRRRTLGDQTLCHSLLWKLALVQGGVTLLAIPTKLLSAPISGREAESCVWLLLAVCAEATVSFLEHGRRYQIIPNNIKLPEGEAHEIW